RPANPKPAPASATHHVRAAHHGCDPATVAPRPPGRAAGTPRRATHRNAARPAAPASATAATTPSACATALGRLAALVSTSAAVSGGGDPAAATASGATGPVPDAAAVG